MAWRDVLRGAVPVVAVLSVAVSGLAGGDLIVDGRFEGIRSGKYLRRDDKGQDWRESRRDTKEGRKLLKLSSKNIGGNKTRKAMIKAHPELNTYLSQRFASAQTGEFTLQYDVYVREILPDDNRSAFLFIGNDSDGKNGPNSTGRERFVFLGFENAGEEGKIHLFAREGQTKWGDKTIVARDLDLGQWHTIVVDVHVADEVYETSVGEMTTPLVLGAFRWKDRAPKRLTHVSFASWNDGTGTFYVDNVVARER